MSAILALAMVVLLTVAAWRDVATRTIPDSIGLIVAGIGVLARLLVGPMALGVSLAITLALFVTLLIAYSRGLIGGGDVKIMSALAIGMSPFDAYRFVIATAIAGGLLGAAYLVASRCMCDPCRISRTSLLGRLAKVEAWRIRRRGPLPYGVAIAAGGIIVLFQPGSF